VSEERTDRSAGRRADDARTVAREIGAAPEQEDLVRALLELEVAPETMRRALDRGALEDAVFEAALDPGRRERTVSAREIERSGGPRADATASIVEAFGLLPPDPDDPYFTDAEAEVFRQLSELSDVWPPELYLPVSRVYGRALARIARAETQAFRERVEPRLRRASGDRLSALPVVHWAFERLLPLSDPLLVGVHRRLLEREVSQARVAEAEERARGDSLPGAVEVALLFCDLKDFTAYANAAGDGAAVEALEQFSQVVTEERGEHGRLLKGLGDGYMLAYPASPDAVAAGERIIVGMRDGDLGVHASVHEGVAVAHEGDYFGRTVNLAARLLLVARRDELVATTAVVEATRDRFEWEPRGAERIRGVSEPVDVYRLVESS
jgi:adenylate cyclase